MRLRLIAPVLLVLAVTAGGFLETRIDVNRDARRDAGNRADIAATEVRNGIDQAANLVESLRRFMLGRVQASVTNAQFADIGARWLSPVGVPAAAWVPQAGGRELRATLVTGASPMTAPGIDLGEEAVVAAAIADPRTLFRVTATPLARIRDGRTGLFLVESAPRLSHGVLDPGYVVLFIPASWLFTAVTGAPQETNARLQLRIGNTSFGDLGDAAAVGSAFAAAGRRFDVLVPRKRVHGAAALLPWLVLGGGLVLAALVGTVAAIAQRRARAQREVDRIFKLSPDLITVTGFDGFWKRVNPAFEKLLGYTEHEAVGRPYLDFVHLDDRERSEAEARRILGGESTIAFENRMVCKDGASRWVEWTATPVPKERLLYGVGRDVTERRRSESEQTALRRVATLVAESVQPQDIFGVVAEEVARVFEVPVVSVIRYDGDDVATECASFSTDGPPSAARQRWSLDGTSVLGCVHRTGKVARIDDYSLLEGELADAARQHRLRSTVGAPIVAGGRIWGAMIVSSREDPLPEGTEARLDDFTELLATAIASAESHEALALLAEEQAALRRVATLVAQGVPPAEIFAAVSDEVGVVFGAGTAVLRFEHDGRGVVFVGVGGGVDLPIGTRWELEDGMASAHVYRTGRSARVDAKDGSSAGGAVAANARRLGFLSTVACPIFVEARLWGAMILSSSEELLPTDVEERLERFTQLLATAIANAESQEALARLVEEQAALRRVATLVAQGVPPEELFAAVTEEVGELLPVGSAAMGRLDPDGMVTTVAAWSPGAAAFPVGKRWIPEGKNAMTMVLQTGRPARLDDFADASGPVGLTAREAGYRSAVGTPIVVEGRLWGVMTAASSAEEPLPSDIEARLSSFTELVATAIANAESSEARRRLAEQQAALRRVATLVAEGVQPPDLFAVMAEEIGRVSDVEATSVVRYEADGTASELANYLLGSPRGLFPVGVRMNIEGVNILRLVRDSAKAARIDDYSKTHGEMAGIVRRTGIKSTVGVPIIVAGRVWGAMVGSTTGPEPLPEDTAPRMSDFTELLATAVENSESREALERLAEEQAALRRIATLVAQGVQPSETFAAVSEEVGRLFGSDIAGVVRFEDDGSGIVYAGVSRNVEAVVPIGTRWENDDALATTKVYRTGRSARADAVDWSEVKAPADQAGQHLRVASTVASPIVVEGRLWGATSVSASEPLPADAEERLAKFSELIATAIANAQSRSELATSRRRIVAASDETRRRIERDLHDGTQQRLVSLALGLRAAEADLPPDRPELRAELSRVASGLAEAVEELRELSRGIHPAILSEGGLGPALRTLARRSRVPVELDTQIDQRLPERLEVAAYYVASEALTNAAKHAHASVVRIDLAEQKGVLRLSIRDDGIGGVDPGRGSGVVGLQDRVEALGGKITIDSTPGIGTSLVATLPVDDETAGAVE